MNTPEAAPQPEPHYRPGATGRAPLAWFILPLLAGYLLADAFPTASPTPLIVAMLPLAAGAGALAVCAPERGFSGRLSFGVWGASFVLAATLLAWAWHNVLLPPPDPVWAELPPREAKLALCPSRLFSSAPGENFAGGIARVVGAPLVMHDLVGLELSFRVRLHAGESAPARGSIVEVNGLLTYLAPPAAGTAPNGFDQYLRHQGVWFTLNRGVITRVLAPASWWTRWCAAQNARIGVILGRGPVGWEARDGNLYAAMTLGQPTLLDEAQRDAFTLMGVMHLFAISGLHVGLVAGALFWCLRRVPRLPRPAGEAASLALAWLYIEITGGSPSARRAGIMLTFYLLVVWLGRPRAALAAIFGAAVFSLLINPGDLWNPGFQLSYSAVLGMILYGVPLLAALQARLQFWRDLPVASRAPWQKVVLWLWRRLLAYLVFSWTALLCIGPLTADYFGVVSAGSMLLSFILVPLLGAVLAAGLVAALLGQVLWPPFTWLTWLVNALGLSVTGLMQAIVNTAMPLPGLHARVQLNPAWAGPVATASVLAVMLFVRPRGRMPPWWYYVLPVIVLAGMAGYALRPA